MGTSTLCFLLFCGYAMLCIVMLCMTVLVWGILYVHVMICYDGYDAQSSVAVYYPAMRRCLLR